MPRRFDFLRPDVSVVDDVSFGQHALMQDAGNQNASGVLAIEHNVPTDLHTTQAGANIIAGPTQRRIVSQHLATRLQITDVADGLALTPGAKRISADAQQVGFGAARETKGGHG
jgi:hypothetical protein